MEFEPSCINSGSKLPANDAVMDTVNLPEDGKGDADTMTPFTDRSVSVQDLKESPPGTTSETPIILDNLTGVATNNLSSPPLDACNVSMPPSKGIQLVKVTPSLPKKRRTKQEIEQSKAMREEQKAQREREKAEKERERVEREREKAEKKAQRESEREAKKQEKEKDLQEKRVKQEQREAEKKKKQEEIQMRQEAKRRKEQEEKEKQDKRQQHFMSFFEKRSSPKGQAKESADVDQKELFPPLPSMPGVTVAKLPSPLKDSTVFDQALVSQEDSFQSDFLERCRRTQTHRKNDSCPQLIEPAEYESSNDCVIVGGDDSEEAASQSRRRLKYKLLQFNENFRPAYWGTWRKKSAQLNPRNPFKKDESLLNYEVDSDEEWEEEEQGESISSSEDEEEPAVVEGEDDEDDDGFFVPHGYLSEGEGDVSEQEMEADVKEPSSVRKQCGKDKDKAALWDLEASRIHQPLKPVCIGCIFEGEESQNPKQMESVQLLNQFRAILLTDGPIDPLQQTSATVTQEVLGVTSKTSGAAGVGVTRNSAMCQPVPEEAMPDLIRSLHGSHLGVQRIVKEFRQFWGTKKASKNAVPDGGSTLSTKDTPSAADGKENVDYSTVCGISKRQLESKIQQIAKKESRPPDYRQRFYVHCDILEKYGIDPTLPAVAVAGSVVSPFSRSSRNQNMLPLTPGVMQTPTRKRAAAVDISQKCFGAKTATPSVLGGVSHDGCVGVSPSGITGVVGMVHDGLISVSNDNLVGVSRTSVGVSSGPVGVSSSSVEVRPTVDTVGTCTTEVVASESVAAKESEPALPPEKRLKVEDKRPELLS